MDSFSFPSKKQEIILALGAESDGNFCLFINGKIHFSESFGDLLEEKNWQKYQKAVLEFIKKNDLQPDIVVTDLHPLYLTSAWGEDLSKKYKAKYIQVQHHIAHIFSAIGENLLQDKEKPAFAKAATWQSQPLVTIYGIAMDGTGYGEDGKIWGGEVFQISNSPTCHSRVGGNPVANRLIRKSDFLLHKNSDGSMNLCIQRIGCLENQTLIGGDLAIREPARMLISILDKVFSKLLLPSPYQGDGLGVRSKDELKRKNQIYQYIKKYYTKNEFELIYNQLKQNFNCLETSSAGRILDAVSLLLGFCGNERKYKHEPIALLEANSGKPYTDLKPKINLSTDKQVLNTTFLFEYLVKNLHKDKKRLAATAQLYVAEGLYEIIKKACHPEQSPYSDEVERSAREYHQRYFTEDSSTPLRYAQNDIFFSGGIANNKIISDYLISQGAYPNKKIYPVKLPIGKLFNRVPRGDAGLSFGQIIYYLFSK